MERYAGMERQFNPAAAPSAGRAHWRYPLFFIELCWSAKRQADIGGLAAAEGDSLALILDGHSPQLTSRFPVYGDTGRARAFPGKFDKVTVGLHGCAPEFACASVVGGDTQSINQRVAPVRWDRGLQFSPAAARSADRARWAAPDIPRSHARSPSPHPAHRR